MNTPIRVAYIFGMGGTGSTLLDLILGSQEDVESVGEVDHLGYLLTNHGRCTCHEEIHSCSYWTAIRSRTEQELPDSLQTPPGPFEFRKRLTDFRQGMRNTLALGNLQERGRESDVKLYNQINHTLFHNILDHSRKDVLVDSSKNPFRCLALSCAPDLFRLKVIYLFRDPRAHLARRKRIRNKNPDRFEAWNQYLNESVPRERNSLFSSSFLQTGLLWKTILYRLFCLKQLDADQVLGIRYRSLCTQPEKVLQACCQFLSVRFDPSTIDPERNGYFSDQRHHNIGGRSIRFGRIHEIQHITKWQNSLTVNDRIQYILGGGSMLNNLQTFLCPGRVVNP